MLIIMLAGVALLLVMAALLARSYRLKRRSRQQLLAQQKDITEKNRCLQHLLTEKEWLLKEVHHRVRNNLQIVISLLNIQSAYLDNDAALHAIRQSQHRISAMSLVHQKAYQSGAISTIDMHEYTQELLHYLKEHFNTGPQLVFACRVDNIQLDISAAVPVGLILNEAITNAIRHSFPGGRAGHITVEMAYLATDQLLLVISDDGIGLGPDFDFEAQPAIGLRLIRMLSEQLEAALKINGGPGCRIEVRFKTAPAALLSPD
ncbi:sensor histidine kinase [Chitinophaga japonensis]|uniref:histidine kinase n=1 Tax=Chitinophaga japonensis TaxID=104662 RepID=A0A562SJC5_CHIJA|nr:histidine kinase dimerization/phosphoacceptor domain -containing protein [Chitinophaga japonensis]TWI80936.1 two-component sensor histidine kinase [Chitinophaga japonensis]